MGSTTSDRNRRKPSFIVFSDDEDDDDTKKLAKPEPKKQELEPEPSQPHHYMAHVPDDIMSAILSRNPWKSISRLQCVSLYWYGLLNAKSPSLPIYSLCSKEPELLAGIFYQKFSAIKPGIYSNQGNFNAEKDIKVKFFTFGSQKEQVDELIERGLYAVDETMPLIPFNFYIEVCRHGLLLCSRLKQFQFNYGHIDRHYVYNPITKKFIWLPNPPESPPHQYVKTGFLVNKESGHYQIIQFPVNLWADPIAKEGLVIVGLYSSLSRGWRTEQFKFHEEENGRPISIVVVR
ncbi:hypothetical protein CsSME_00033584 [Camellia sinensis var. sinensis]